jgi:cell division protein FtsL
MTRTSLLLLVAVVASGLWLVRAAYDNRRLFADLNRAQTEQLRLEGEHKRLEAERQLQATTLRVERTAREKLAMRTVTPAVTMYESVAGALLPVAPASGAASAAGGARP